MKNFNNPGYLARILFGLLLIAVFLSFPYLVSGKEKEDTQELGQISPGEIANLLELTVDGKSLSIPTKTFRTIIANNSRLAINFNRDLMRKSLSYDVKRQDWEKLKEQYVEKNIEKDSPLRAALIQQFLLESVAYQMSVTARVISKSGVEYDLPVEGYTSLTEIVNEKADQKKTIMIMDRRLLCLDVDADTENLKVVESLPDTIVIIPDTKTADGDRLVITVTNYHGISPKSAKWELELSDIGLYMKQEATLLLVKRLGNAEEDKDLENNFKPAPGSSFLLKWKSRNKLWNFIDPAIGVNGSFLDFRSDKDLEVGVGIVFSLFNGLLQFNYGWNLHVKDHRQYWSIGLGFLDITDKIKELKKG